MKRTLITLALFATIVAAQSQSPPSGGMRPVTDPGAPARVGVGITERSLALEEAIQLALANNLDIDIERTARDTAIQNVQVAQGLFDPTFRWAPLFTSDNLPVASLLQGAGGKLTTRNFSSNASLRQRLPRYGTTGFLDFNNLRSTTTNPFASFNPALTSFLAVGVTQPILRNFRIDRERAEIRVRQKQVDLAGVDLETRVIDIVTRTQQAYYDLVAARESVAVSQEQVSLGREQLAINQRLVETGTLAMVEISAAEAELQRRVDTWYSSLAIVTEAENSLKILISPERAASIWNDVIVPTDESLLQPATADLREALATAIRRRPELRSVSVQNEINGVQKELNANLRRPEVNAIAQYSMNGLAGSLSNIPNPFANQNTPVYDRLNALSAAQGLPPVASPSFGTVPTSLIGNYGTALSNLFGGNYQSFQVGVSMDFNLRNRSAEASYGQTLINEKRLRLEKARAEQLIEAQVRNALQNIETSRQRIAAAEASAKAAQEKLQSERRLYETGESTNFLVLTRQNEYADSRRRTVVARLDFNKSVARLEQALGTTLAVHRITVD
ncbi:MAG: TolC family protein [Bryobacteraceae bacterium]|nr:TolC family protein [Bryobacteraceae bacterium]